jgi:hypothetical protein
MSVVITEKVTVEELDEAMRYIQKLLLDSKLTPRRRNILLTSLDDLLDARLEIAEKQEANGEDQKNSNK